MSLKSNRVERISFSPTELTSSSGGIINVFSDSSINGTIRKVELVAGNHTNTGSLFPNISGGASELIWSKVGGVSGTSVDYPHVYTSDNVRVTGSPSLGISRIAMDTLHVIGSGMGNTKSGLGLNIYYQ